MKSEFLNRYAGLYKAQDREREMMKIEQLISEEADEIEEAYEEHLRIEEREHLAQEKRREKHDNG